MLSMQFDTPMAVRRHRSRTAPIACEQRRCPAMPDPESEGATAPPNACGYAAPGVGFALYQQIIQEPAEPVSAWAADAPAQLRELIACLLEKEPTDRPGGAAEVEFASAPK